MLSVVIPVRDLSFSPQLPPGADEILLVGGNDGVAHAKNLGAHAAAGSVLLFLDDDVLLEGDLRVLKSRPAKEAWWTCTYVDRTGDPRTRRMITGLNYASSFGLHAASIGPFLGIRKALFDRAGGFPEHAVHEDTSLSRRLGELGAHLSLAPLRASVLRPFTRYGGMWDRAARNLGHVPSPTAPIRRLVPATASAPGTSGSS